MSPQSFQLVNKSVHIQFFFSLCFFRTRRKVHLYMNYLHLNLRSVRYERGKNIPLAQLMFSMM